MKNKGIKLSLIDGRKTVEGLGYYSFNSIGNIKQLINQSVSLFGDKAAFKFKRNSDTETKTYKQFGADIDALGTALISLGMKGKRIAIISENRYEWAISFFSIVNGTGIAVPLDKYLPEVEIENLIHRGQVDAIFFSPHFSTEMLALSQKENSIKYFICMEQLENYDAKFTSIPQLIEKGKQLIDKGETGFTAASIDPEALSLILFTSGTTSMAKGVMLNQRNICYDVAAMASIIKVYHTDVHLSVLPLHHTFELSVGMLLMLNSGVCIAYCEGIKHIAKNLNEFGVTVLVVVPAILEAMYKKMKEGIRKSGKENLLNAFGSVSGALRMVGIDVRRKLFSSVLNKLGPGLRLAVSGAAPLDKEVVTGFDRIGLRLIQGYGLTETSPVIAANNDFYNKPGTVGFPMKGIDVAIDNPDENGMGEIITRGPNVMMGYYEDEAGTKESIKGGWFYTGDLGYIDDEGYLVITGRAKSMIVLTNGKKAFPEEYEMLLNDIEGIKESFVWGDTAPDGDIQICAKLVLNKEALISKLGKDPDVSEISEYIQRTIKEINKDIPQYKIIRYFVLTYDELVKTTTMKIKRPVEQNSIRETLDNMQTSMRKASGKMLNDL